MPSGPMERTILNCSLVQEATRRGIREPAENYRMLREALNYCLKLLKEKVVE